MAYDAHGEETRRTPMPVLRRNHPAAGHRLSPLRPRSSARTEARAALAVGYRHAVKMMKAIAIISAVCALALGLRAARLWYLSSQVKPVPEGPEPVVPEMRAMWWQSAQIKAAGLSADLNARAAKWTAAAVVFGTIASVSGAYVSN